MQDFAVEARSFSSLDELLNWAVTRIGDILNCESVSIYTMDPFRQELHLRAAVGPQVDKRVGVRQQRGDGLAGWVAQIGEPLIVHDVRRVGAGGRGQSSWYSDHSCILAPLRRQDVVSGVVAVTMKHNEAGFTVSDLGILSGLAYSLSGVLMPLVVVEKLNGVSLQLMEVLQASSNEIRRYERDVQDIQKLTESIVESIPLALLVYNYDLRVTFRNSAAVKLFGEEGCVSCEALPRIGLETDETEWRQKLAWVIRAGESVVLDRLTYQGGAEDRLLDLMCTPLLSVSGETIGGVLLAKDVTEEVQIGERLATSERLALLGRLSAEVAHQINNPLDGILRFIRLAMRTMDHDDPARRYLESSEKGLQRIGHIVSTLLEYPRKGQIAPECFYLNEVINEAIHLYEHRAESNHVRIHIDVPAEIPARPAGELIEVFANLFKNSLDAMREKGGELSVSARKGDGMVEVTVADTGPGIPENMREKIFHPFFTTKENGHGFGLGLSICRDILNRHGGEIELARSERGTVFVIRVPVEKGSKG